MGDQLVVTVSDLQPDGSGAPPCDFNGLGFAVGGEIRMSVDEHQARYGSDGDLCMPSAGALQSATGWTYQNVRKQVVRGVYGSASSASKGSCSGLLSLELWVPDDSSWSTGSVVSRLSIEYQASSPAADCPATCLGIVTGTMTRTIEE